MNNNEYAASRNMVKSKNKRGYTGGGAGNGQMCGAFHLPLNFFCYFSFFKKRKVSSN
jgi:hypothetical protein